MGRRGRKLVSHCCYHITHRCHNREFLFRFSQERNDYLELLRDISKSYGVAILDYMITSNHVHLLVWSKNSEAISAAMKYTQGTMAQKYNRTKGREGSFWRNRYHATLIENGMHLGRCLFYIDFNMVRAGVVKHPSKWRWSGYHELSGNRKRYRILNQKVLLHCFRMTSMEGFFNWHNQTLKENLDSYTYCHQREAFWSEALAVGSQDWIKQLSASVHHGTNKVLPLESLKETAGASEDEASYALKTSKKEAAYLSRTLTSKYLGKNYKSPKKD